MMVNVDDDTATIAAVLNGDVQAFATIIHRYEPALLRLAISRLRNRQVAEELVQDAFLSAYKSLHTYNPQYQFRTWLWTIQLNKLHQHRLTVSRRARLLPTRSCEQSELERCANEDDASPADRALLEERDAELHRLLEHLPEVQADSLRLRFFGELPFQEIADVMGCSLSSAKNRVRKGLLRMADLMSKPGECQSGNSQ